MSSSQLKQEIKALAKHAKAKTTSKFFKTGAGQYGEGDLFLGVSVPEQRRVARKYGQLPLSEIQILLTSKYHDYRSTALLILVAQFQKGSEADKKIIYEHYLRNTKYINNWDLVDISAPKIVGEYLCSNPGKKTIFKELVTSDNLWERRIAVLATYPFIKKGEFGEIKEITQKLLLDKEDLIHKAVGWMLREMGKVEQKEETEFLDQYAHKMPRTMLRYAIERLPETDRQHYLKQKG